MKQKLITFCIFILIFFSKYSLGFEISEQEFEFFGYEINGKFSRAHENSLGIDPQFVFEQDTKKNLQYVELKPLFEFDGLTAHSNYGLVWKDEFLISFGAKFVKTLNNKIMPFRTIEQCNTHLKNSINYIKTKYGFKFQKINNKENNQAIDGRFVAEGRLNCRKTYEFEGYSSEGFILSLEVLGSKWYQSDFEYREKKENLSIDKITPFGIEFGAINLTNFEEIVLDEQSNIQSQNSKIANYIVKNPKFPLSFFDNGEYHISTFDNEIWGVSANVLIKNYQLDDFQNIFKELVKKYGTFFVNSQSFKDKNFFWIKDIDDFKKIMEQLKKEEPSTLYLWTLAFDDRYKIQLISFFYKGDYHLSLAYTNKFYESKMKLYQEIMVGKKDNLEKSL